MVGTERDLKRIAIQLAAQLPESEAEALAVLVFARDLVVGYLHTERAPCQLRVVPMRVDETVTTPD